MTTSDALRARWTESSPFRWLPPEALTARMRLPASGTPEVPAAFRAGVQEGKPARLDQSRVPWLAEEPQRWPLVPFWPLLDQFAADLHTSLHSAAREGAPRTERAERLVREFVLSISTDVSRLVTPVALECYRARGTADSAAQPGSAEADAAAELARGFASAADAQSLLEQYVPLTRQVAHVLATHAQCFRQAISRLAEDQQRITPLVQGRTGDLIGARALGDLHEHGAVTEFRFADGGVLYKPHGLAVDDGLAAVFTLLERESPGTAPAIPRGVDRGEYGWQELLHPDAATSAAQIRTYYRRTGALLALAHALRATDLHRENVLCRGGELFVLDPECFFGSAFETRADGRWEEGGEFRSTVLCTGILPDPMKHPGMDTALDMSVLGAVDPAVGLPQRRGLSRTGDGELRFDAVAMSGPAPANLPTLGGKNVSVRGYEDAVLDGFERAYRWLLSNRDELLAPGGPLDDLRPARTRYIRRGTSLYVKVLSEMGRPDTARDWQAQEETVNTLWPGEAHEDPVVRAVFEHERAALLRGQVPTFTRAAGGRTLLAGDASVDGAFRVDGVELVRQRVARLCERDLRLQRELARSALRLPWTETRAPRRYRPREAEPPERAELLAAAGTIRDTLADRMAHTGGPAWWLTVSDVDDGWCRVRPTTGTLYDGLAGIALFSGYLDLLTGTRSEVSEQAEDAMMSWTEEVLDRARPVPLGRAGQLGAFDGVWGTVYTAACLSVARSDRALLRWADQIISATSEGISAMPGWDLISGTAGVGLVAAELAGTLGSARPAAVTALEATAEHLQEVLEHDRIPAGMAHGLSGAVLAFCRGQRSLPEQGYLDAAEVAATAEQAVFRDPRRGWHDHLDETGEDDKREGWCRGASGIGMAMAELAALCRCSVEPWNDRFAVARHLASSRAVGTEHSLCHGAFGAWESLRAISLVTGDAADSDRVLGGIVVSGRETGWCTGSAGSLPDPGLMTGLAGIGLGLLRAAAPRRVPRVLTLELPADVAD